MDQWQRHLRERRHDDVVEDCILTCPYSFSIIIIIITAEMVGKNELP